MISPGRIISWFAIAVLGTFAGARAIEAAPPTLYAAGACTPAGKPGRIRCRASIELPLEAQASKRLSWGELVVVDAKGAVIPLRGRLGVLDSESHDDARIAWSFSVAAQSPGDHALVLHARATIVDRTSKNLTAVEAPITLAIHVGQ